MRPFWRERNGRQSQQAAKSMKPTSELSHSGTVRFALSLAIAGIGIFALAPYVLAFRYIHPSFDDMWYFYAADTMGLSRASIYWYLEISGRFALNTVATVLSTAFRSDTAYRLVCAGNFAALVFALQRLFNFLVTKSAIVAWQLAVLVLATWLTVMSPSEGLYWFAGSASFTLGTAMAFYAIGGMIQWKEGRNGTAWWAFWLFVAVGMNELNMLMIVAALTYVLMRDFALQKTPRRTAARFGVPIFLASLAVFLAPGTWHRVQLSRVELPASGHLQTALDIGMHEFPRDIYTLLVFSPVLVLVAFLLLSSHSKPGFGSQGGRVRLLAVAAGALIFGTIFSMIVFYAFTQGQRTIGRVLNVVYLVSIVGFVLASVRFGLRRFDGRASANPLALALLAICFATYLIRPGSNVREAYRELLGGEWNHYDQEVTNRRVGADQHPGENLMVPSIANRPWSLFVFDVSTDSSQRYNEYYARFYRLSGMRTGPTPKP